MNIIKYLEIDTNNNIKRDNIKNKEKGVVSMYKMPIERTPFVLLQEKIENMESKEELDRLSWEERIKIIIACLTVQLALEEKLEANMEMFNWKFDNINEALMLSTKIIYDLNKLYDSFNLLEFIKETVRLHKGEVGFDIHENLAELKRINQIMKLEEWKVISEVAYAVSI